MSYPLEVSVNEQPRRIHRNVGVSSAVVIRGLTDNEDERGLVRCPPASGVEQKPWWTGWWSRIYLHQHGAPVVVDISGGIEVINALTWSLTWSRGWCGIYEVERYACDGSHTYRARVQGPHVGASGETVKYGIATV